MSVLRSLFFSVILVTVACSGPKLLNRGDYESEDAEYRDIVAMYDAGTYETALKWTKSYEDRGVKGARWPHILHLRGLIHMALKKPALAVTDFERALAANDTFLELNQEIVHHLSWANYELGKLTRALELANKVQINSLDTHLQVNHRILKGGIYLKRGLWVEAASEMLATNRLAPASARLLAPMLDDALKRIESISDLRSLLKEFGDTSISDQLIYRVARAEINEGNTSEGQGLLRALISRYPNSTLYAAASRHLKASNLDVPSDAAQIGVLLPISGKLAPIGNKVLQAVRMGIKTSSSLRGKVHLVVEDSGEAPSDALAALDKLIYQHHVMAVLGPITSKGLEGVAQRAQELGVPLISLARRDAPEGDFVFQGSLTLKQQIEGLVKFAIEKQKKKRFAILYPQDRLGEAAADYFWSAVESMGGEIRAVHTYPAEETDFRTSVDGLTGSLYPAARERELAQLQARRAKQDSAGNGKKRREKTVELPPVVDFDAVFIPDVLKAAGQIVPMFAYRDVDTVEFLGTSLWNSDEIARTLQKSAEKKVFFVDVFSNREGAGSVAQKFVEQFQALHSAEPGPVEAVGFDAAAVLAQAVGRLQGSNSRERLRRLLLDTRDFSGVTGNIRVNNSVLYRSLKVFTFRNGQVGLADQM
jgi:branched-chain amino acid transport system substrate-binding protein